MQTIRSIICFNGGTGGDFLKATCCQQLEHHNQLQVHFTDQGMTLITDNHNYFKQICEEDYFRDPTSDSVPLDLDFDRVCAVDSTHFYRPWFASIASQTYFIDYPDHCASGIVEVFMQKNYKGNFDTFLSYQKSTLPEWAQHKLSPHNAIDIFALLWVKQLRIWRSLPNLVPIKFEDFFDPTTFQHWVEQLNRCSLTDVPKFHTMHSQWLESNDTLASMLA